MKRSKQQKIVRKGFEKEVTLKSHQNEVDIRQVRSLVKTQGAIQYLQFYCVFPCQRQGQYFSWTPSFSRVFFL